MNALELKKLTVLGPGLEESAPELKADGLTLTPKGSGMPLSSICFRRTIDAATIANVVRTAPIPQLKTSAVFRGSVSRITLR